MKNKSIIQLWGEFIDLSWGGKPKIDYRDLKDLELFPKVFLRKWGGDWTIHYLPIGTVLTIPAPWPSIWSEFVGWLGGIDFTTGMERLTVVDIFARDFINIVKMIDKNLCNGYEYGGFEEEMDNLVKIGTRNWRNIFTKFWNINLPTWTILDIKGKKEI